jgi:hypothetical protein
LLTGKLREYVVFYKRTALDFLCRIKNPYFVFVYVFIAGRSNEYVDHSWLNAQLLGRLMSLKGFRSFKLTGTGVLLLIGPDSVVKVPLGEAASHSLKQNFQNYKLLKNTSLSHYVAYNLEFLKGCYKMDLLSSANASADEVKSIIEDLRSFSETKELSSEFVAGKCAQGVDVLKRFTGEEVAVPGDILLHSSVMHGDLTEGNIMKSAENNNVLIDLDRFDFFGIDGIDELHFKVTQESVRRKCSFFESLSDMIAHEQQRGLLTVYLLHRVAVEHVEGVVLDRRYYEKALSLYKALKR